MDYTKILAALHDESDKVQDMTADLNHSRQTVFAAGCFEKFPDSYDWYEMAHEVRNCIMRATVELANLNSAIEQMEQYAEERQGIEQMREEAEEADERLFD